MNEENISAEEAAINKAIAWLEDVGDVHPDVGMMPEDKIALGAAWTQVAVAINEYNKSLVTYRLAEAGKDFATNPSPENWATFQAAAEEYVERD